MKNFLIFTFLVLLFAYSVFAQALSDSLYVEYRQETAGDKIDTIKLYKKGSIIKLYRSGKHGDFMTLINYSADEYCDFGIDNGVTGNRYGKINYDIICSMWKVIFNGMTPLIKQYVKLPDKQVILGKECEVYDSGKLSFMNSTMQYYFYGVLMMKMEKPGNVIEAIVYDENPIFSENEFGIPENVQWLYDYRKK
ncbi:MAG: hypothetical protein IT281_05705 [Ignavibacteria bacterium]|nr:hypothetical protein [Ignavibacteria bacterium]